MNKRTIIPLFVCLLAFLIVLMLLQIVVSNRLQRSLEQSVSSSRIYEEYIAYTSINGNFEDTDDIISIMYDYAGMFSLVLYVPISVCRSCFTTLMFFLQDLGYPMEKIVVLSQNNDISLKREAQSYGCSYFNTVFTKDEIPDIIVFRKVNGYLPCSIRYKQGYDAVLSVFLDDSNYNKILNLDD